MEDNLKIYCKRIKELREEHSFTQQYVADYLNIDRSNYSKYELGKLELSIEMLNLLADLYSVSVDYILGRTEY